MKIINLSFSALAVFSAVNLHTVVGQQFGFKPTKGTITKQNKDQTDAMCKAEFGQESFAVNWKKDIKSLEDDFDADWIPKLHKIMGSELYYTDKAPQTITFDTSEGNIPHKKNMVDDNFPVINLFNLKDVLKPHLASVRVAGDDPDDVVPLPVMCKVPIAEKSGKASGDPHFRTWSGIKFDFHGACDLVLLEDSHFANKLGIRVHIRTKISTWWSSIETAAIRVGDDVLEMMGGLDGGRVWLNGKEVKVQDRDSFHLSGFGATFRKISPKQNKIRIEFGQSAISIETYKTLVAVNVNDKNGNRFQNSVGLMGSYSSGEMLARDGVVLEDPIAFGKEWQVRGNEPMLFHSLEGAQYPQECAMPLQDASAGRRMRRRLGEILISDEAASLACARVPEEDRDACIFDVLATQDMDTAGSY